MADGWDDWGGSAATTPPVNATSPSSGGTNWGSGDDGWGQSSGGNRRDSSANGTRNGPSAWSTPRSSATSFRPRLQVASMVVIEKLPVDASIHDIRQFIGRYGKISRLVLDYQFDDDKLYCFMDFENPEIKLDMIMDRVNKTKFKNRDIVMSRNTFSGGNSSGTPSSGRPRGACFKCNEEGHMSRDCPTAGGGGGGGGGGGRGPVTCYKCNEEGHMSRDCPTAGGGGGGRGGRGGRGGGRHHPYERNSNNQGSSGGGWGSSTSGGDGGWGTSTSGGDGGWGTSTSGTTSASNDGGWGTTSTPAANQSAPAPAADDGWD